MSRLNLYKTKIETNRMVRTFGEYKSDKKLILARNQQSSRNYHRKPEHFERPNHDELFSYSPKMPVLEYTNQKFVIVLGWKF